MNDRKLRRAYAILDLSPPVTEASLKQHYKALVRKWHPDRFEDDPAGKAEATSKLRNINIAYELVLASLAAAERYGTAPTPEADSAAPRRTGEEPMHAGPQGFSLSREQIDAIVDSINERNRVFPRMSAELWVSLGVASIYLAALCVLLWAGGARQADLLWLLFYLTFPMRIIWFNANDEERHPAIRLIIRPLAWALLALPLWFFSIGGF